MHYPLPEYEQERLADLYSVDLLYSQQEDDYDNIAALMAFISGCATGHVSIIGENVQWLKAKVGSGDKETPRAHAFCAHVIMKDELMIVEDTTQDDRFVNNPLVTGPQQLRFYAGIPIFGPAGYPIGTVCALDNKPKSLTEAQKDALRAVARQATRLIELRKRNIDIAAKASEQLQLEHKTLNHHVVQQDEERKRIGYELHENFCQVLAAALQHLAALNNLSAEQSTALSRVKEMITDLLKNMRAFSYDIHPVGQLPVGMEEKLFHIIRQYEQLSGLTIHFDIKGELDTVCLANINHLFRIILEWLGVYELNPRNCAGIQLSLHISNEVSLCFSAAASCITENDSLPVLLNSIRKRCEMIQGKASLLNTENRKILLVTLPLT